MPPFPSVLAYQQPNAKKIRRIAQKAEQLAAKGVVPRRQKQLLNRRPVVRTAKKAVTEANNNPDRDYYDIWEQESECWSEKCLKWPEKNIQEPEGRKERERERVLSSDDPILALPVFPSRECEDQHGARTTVV